MGTEAAATIKGSGKHGKMFEGNWRKYMYYEGEMRGKEGEGDQSSSRELAFSLPSIIPGRYVPKFPI